ncbi:MAG: glycosyl hydrolase-related protein, partial [Bacteroidota bacterium]
TELQSPLFTVEPASVIITSFKPSIAGKGWMVRLFTASGKSADVSLKWNGATSVTSCSSNLFEDREEQLRFPITLASLGIKTIKVEKQ